jgi:hypothetical protein
MGSGEGGFMELFSLFPAVYSFLLVRSIYFSENSVPMVTHFAVTFLRYSSKSSCYPDT